MPFERYEILLPLTDNDGAAVEPEKLQQTRRALVQRFGAVTMDIQPVSGPWVHGEQEYHDELIRFVVDAEASPSTEAFFAEFKTTLKTRFRQIDIWITAYPIRLL